MLSGWMREAWLEQEGLRRYEVMVSPLRALPPGGLWFPDDGTRVILPVMAPSPASAEWVARHLLAHHHRITFANTAAAAFSVRLALWTPLAP